MMTSSQVGGIRIGLEEHSDKVPASVCTSQHQSVGIPNWCARPIRFGITKTTEDIYMHWIVITDQSKTLINIDPVLCLHEPSCLLHPYHMNSDESECVLESRFFDASQEVTDYSIVGQP